MENMKHLQFQSESS